MYQGPDTFYFVRTYELTEEQLEKMARHIVYERRMWQWAYDTLMKEDQRPGSMDFDQRWQNALIESHALHLRALTEFFCPRKSPRRTDVFATHYFPSWDPGPEGDELLASVLTLNKRVGHLTLSRIQYETRNEDERSWYQCRGPMTELLNRFEAMFGEKERNWFSSGHLSQLHD